MGEWWIVVWYEDGKRKSYKHIDRWRIERLADSLVSEGYKVEVYGYME